MLFTATVVALMTLTNATHAAASTVAASEEMNCCDLASVPPPLSLQRMDSAGSTTSSKGGRTLSRQLSIETKSPDSKPLEDEPSTLEISPDTITASGDVTFGGPIIPIYVYESLFTAFQTTVDQHFIRISYEEVIAGYPRSAQTLNLFPIQQQLAMARFSLSFSCYLEITDDALAELMQVLMPETFLGQFADDSIEGMQFAKDKKACLALKNAIHLAPTYVDVARLYEIYGLAPALYYGGHYTKNISSPNEKLNIIKGFFYPHPHFELLERWNRELAIGICSAEYLETTREKNADYLRSIPTVYEYTFIAREFGLIASYATLGINKAMILNWLVEHKATPALRRAIVEQTAALMNQPDFYANKIEAALDPQNTHRSDFMWLDPMCQPTDILEALYQTTAAQHHLLETDKIEMQWEIVRRVAAEKIAAGGMSDRGLAERIKLFVAI